MYRYRFLLLFLLLSPLVSAGQGTALERLLERFANRSWVQAGGKLFLHTDKTLYTNNETVWFAGYLSSGAAVPLGAHHTLSVALQHLESGAVVHSELYVMDSGLSSGSMLLPDSIPGGSYRLLAYTNVVGRDGMPVEFFEQPLTVRSTLETKFSASVLLLDTAASYRGARRISVRASGLPIDRKGSYAPAKVRYRIGNGAELTMLTDGQGSVGLNYDPDTLGGMRSISASVSHGGETRHLVLALPATEPKVIRAGFYPEGGQLVSGLEGRVGFELRTASGRPLSVRAELLCDGVAMDTVESGPSGMGSFLLRPLAGRAYTLRARRGSFLDRDTVLALPVATEGLPVIGMKHALAGDTLDFTLSATRRGSYHVLLHNTRELLASFSVEARPGGRKVRVALKDVPKGLAAVTVLDTLGVPLAERLFLAHYGGTDLVGATTDRAIYGPREKVTLKLKLQAPAGGQALVSVAAVQGNRIESAKFRDMESWSYLESELGALPPSAGGFPYRDRDYLETLLLVKGWRRFAWEQEKWPASADTAGLYRSLELSGRITKNGKELDKSIALTLLADTVFGVINTDSLGKFTLLPDQMLVDAGRQLYFSVNRPNKEIFDIKFNNPHEKMLEMLSHNMPKMHLHDILSLNPIKSQNSGNGKGIALKTVEIKGNKDNLLTHTKGSYNNRNACGDYVCIQNFLNCGISGHEYWQPGSTLPVIGKIYYKMIGSRPNLAVIGTSYSGCIYDLEKRNTVFKLNGRQYAREFYVNDYKVDASESYQSTVYWSPFVQLGSDGDTELSFYTSDLKAPYRIVVQGLGEGQVVTGGASFKVE